MKSKEPLILILTDKNDAHANHLIDVIQGQQLPFFRLNLDVDSLRKTIASFYNGKWEIKTSDGQLFDSDVSCVWSRRTYVELLLEEHEIKSASFKIWKGEWNKTLLGFYSSIAHVPWLNPFRNAYFAENKYRQMALADSIGMRCPSTIVSNNKEKLFEFTNQHEAVVLKLMQQDFYKSDKNEFLGIYVNKVTTNELKDFNEIGENPIVLQEYIEKDYEVRYTVVGDKHFACKIESQKSNRANTDWRRYDIPHTPHSSIEPPVQIQGYVKKFMSTFDLQYGALDFIVTSEKEWYFLELNSMGQYLWIEDLSGLKISEAIVAWLRNKL